MAKLAEHQAGEILQALDLLGRQQARDGIDDAERADADAGRDGERDAGVEANVRGVDDERGLRKARVDGKVRDDQGLVVADRDVAECDFARHADVGMSLVRLDVGFCRIEDADESDRHVEQSAGKAAELFHERVDRRLDDRQLG